MTSDGLRALPPMLDEVECWLADLDTSGAADDVSILDAHEQERFSRLRSDQHRQRYLRAHVQLRRLLALRCGCAPRQVAFTVGLHGKPALAGASPVRFSLSHSAGLAVIALSDTRTVGIDIEQSRIVPEAMALANRWFQPEEAVAIASLPEAQRSASFLTCWTRKEAVLKTIGTGLTRSPASFFVGTTVAPHRVPLESMLMDLRSVELDLAAAVLSIAATVDGDATIAARHRAP